MKKSIAVAGVGVAALIVAGCSGGGGNRTDANLANKQLKTFQQTQPAPSYAYSQLRQNLIEVETAQAQATQTTSFFFNLGIADPVMTCPSIGLPIPTTDQITNPMVETGSSGGGSLPQLDPNGVYAGQSSGTNVICVNAGGKGYDVYWEGDVLSLTGAVAWDYSQHHMAPVNNPTAEFSTGKK